MTLFFLAMMPLTTALRYPDGFRLPNPAVLRPMRLLRIPEPFDHPDFL